MAFLLGDWRVPETRNNYRKLVGREWVSVLRWRHKTAVAKTDNTTSIISLSSLTIFAAVWLIFLCKSHDVHLYLTPFVAMLVIRAVHNYTELSLPTWNGLYVPSHLELDVVVWLALANEMCIKASGMWANVSLLGGRFQNQQWLALCFVWQSKWQHLKWWLLRRALSMGDCNEQTSHWLVMGVW